MMNNSQQKGTIDRLPHTSSMHMQEAAFQLYRPIIAGIEPPPPAGAKVDSKPEDGEVAAEEGEIEEQPAASQQEPGTGCWVSAWCIRLQMQHGCSMDAHLWLRMLPLVHFTW